MYCWAKRKPHTSEDIFKKNISNRQYKKILKGICDK